MVPEAGRHALVGGSNIDFDSRKLYLEQSKRRAEVCLPIEDDLYDMLVQQREDFGQAYVAPRVFD